MEPDLPIYRGEVPEHLQQAVRKWRCAATGKLTVEQLRDETEAMPGLQRDKHKAALNVIADIHTWLMQRFFIPSDRQIIDASIECLGHAMEQLVTECPFRWHA